MRLLVDTIFNMVYNEVRHQLENSDDTVIFRKTRLKQKVSKIITQLIQ